MVLANRFVLTIFVALLSVPSTTCCAWAEDKSRALSFDELTYISSYVFQVFDHKYGPTNETRLDLKKINESYLQRASAAFHPDLQTALQAFKNETLNRNAGRAAVAWRAALLHNKLTQDYVPATHCSLLETGLPFVDDGTYGGRKRQTLFLFEELEVVYERSDSVPQECAELTVLFGQLSESSAFRPTFSSFAGSEKKAKKRLKSFWQKALETLPRSSNETLETNLLFEYFYQVLLHRWFAVETSLDGFEELMERSVRARQRRPALYAAARWSNLNLIDGRVERTLDRLEALLTKDFEGVTWSPDESQRIVSAIIKGMSRKRPFDEIEDVIQELGTLSKLSKLTSDDYDYDGAEMIRVEPNFRYVVKPDFIRLHVDVDETGDTVNDSIEVLETTSKKMIKPSLRALKRWVYVPKFENGEFVAQEDVEVSFTVWPSR